MEATGAGGAGIPLQTNTQHNQLGGKNTRVTDPLFPFSWAIECTLGWYVKRQNPLFSSCSNHKCKAAKAPTQFSLLRMWHFWLQPGGGLLVIYPLWSGEQTVMSQNVSSFQKNPQILKLQVESERQRDAHGFTVGTVSHLSHWKQRFQCWLLQE